MLFLFVSVLFFIPVFSDQFSILSDFRNNPYVDVQKILKSFFVNGSTHLIDLQQKISSSKNAACFRDVHRIYQGIRTQEDWALHMMDAVAFFANGHGFVEGISLFLGSSEICLNVTPPGFSSQFCSFNVYLPMEAVNFARLDLCLPSTCEEDSLNSLMTSWEDFARSVGIFVLRSKVICHEENINEQLRDPAVFIILSVCLFIIGLVIIATCFDVLLERRVVMGKRIHKRITTNFINSEKLEKKYDKLQYQEFKINKYEKGIKLLLCFSALRNGRKLFEMRPGKHFDCFDGIRVLSLGMVVMGHMLILIALNMDNTFRIFAFQQDTNSFVFQLLYNFIYSVDSFFAMSGLLVSYIFLKLDSKRKRPSWSRFYLDRIIRLSPAHYVIIIIMEVLFLRHRSLGYHHFYEGIRHHCEAYVWSNFLYINNIVKDPCIGFTWYLACDVQFYFISPLILTQMIKNKSRAMQIMLLLICMSAVATFTVAYTNEFYIANFTNVLDFLKQSVKQTFDLYMQPHCRIGTYVIGMACGWILYETKCESLLKKKYQKYLLWFLCFFCLYWSVWFTYHFETDLILSSICFFLLRYVWTIGLCILIYLCCTGDGGIINSILSWNGWTFFSRISYSTYLVHFVIIHYLTSMSLKDLHGTLGIMILYFLTYIQYVILGGLLLHLLIEAPANNIRDLLYEKKRK